MTTLRSTRLQTLTRKSLECISAPDNTVSEAVGSFAATEGQYNCARDRGERFPSYAETAAEIVRAVNPQRLSSGAHKFRRAAQRDSLLFQRSLFVFSLANALPQANRDRTAASIIASDETRLRRRRTAALTSFIDRFNSFPVSLSLETLSNESRVRPH